MDSIDLSRAEHRARRHYEWARARRALIGFTPALIVVTCATTFARHPAWTLAFGGAMFVLGAGLLWYGRDVRRAVLPGVAAGLVPLVFGLCAFRVGHICTGDNCMMFCVPACTVGGLVAGLGVAAVALGRSSGLGFWIAAAGMSLLTGAMGCSCVGYWGVVGLAVGFVSGTVPGVLRRMFVRPAS
jgi:hypothetical protein